MAIETREKEGLSPMCSPDDRQTTLSKNVVLGCGVGRGGKGGFVPDKIWTGLISYASYGGLTGLTGLRLGVEVRD